MVFNQPCNIVVNILEPISYEEFAQCSSKELAEKAFNVMTTGLQTLRA
jgi:hypothetical protein